MGFEPMMRVLQTLALPLGDVAIKLWLAVMACAEPFRASRLLYLRERAMGFGPTTFSLARRRTTTVLRPRFGRSIGRDSAERQNRTDDTAIFSRVLYQLSYLGDSVAYWLSVRDFTCTWRDCQANFLLGQRFSSRKSFSTDGADFRTRTCVRCRQIFWFIPWRALVCANLCNLWI